MALLLKNAINTCFHVWNDLSDKRSKEYAGSFHPIVTAVILYLWHQFVFNWGVKFMEHRKSYNLRPIILFYNGVQVVFNIYLAYQMSTITPTMSITCSPVDYSNNPMSLQMIRLGYLYHIMKILDLIDTIFFVLRKKAAHLSFLHTYHHFGMVVASFIGFYYVCGGHSIYVPQVNTIIHAILYSYYLLTAYDSQYGKIIWMKKLITLSQLAQFFILFLIYVPVLFAKDCAYPKWVPVFFIPQNLLLIFMFSDFYIRTYIIAPKKKKALNELNKQSNSNSTAKTLIG